MEDDDEFGDLDTDVLQQFQPTPVQPPPLPPVQPPPPSPVARTVDLNDMIPSDDEEILYGSKSSGFLKLGGSDVNPDANLNNIDESSVRVLQSNDNNNNNKIKDDLMEENFRIEEAGEEEDGFLIPGD